MARRERGDVRLEDDPLWYKDAIIYELHVRAFADSDGDGIGDFPGLTEKLDYLQDLGVTALWLLPFYPSPLKDDGYDIADYTNVHPAYGTLRDCRRFLKEAHRRGLRVITEMVINHTSDQHPWFARARQAKPASRSRDFYVWSDTPERYGEARIIFQDFEQSNWAWDPQAEQYYWHRFYSQQPDLNFDNPSVHQAVFRAMDFWLRMGVDGMRLDAIPYLYERDGTNCENLPETHEFLKKVRGHVDGRFPNRLLLAEANQWPEEAVAYMGDGDECHMAFHFPVMPRLFMAIQMEDRFPVIDILEQTPPIPVNCQWAFFLRNHDELTLEMVTDEERDYMYRVFAHDVQARINLGIRRRLAPLLGNNRRRIELMNGLLFALPGTPVLYYGDEIGMGDNFYLGDRNGVRTPMQWSGDRNAGFSRANPQRLYLPVIIDPEYHFESINVEAQQNNPSSMLWWTKRIIALRRRFKAFSRGALEFLYPENRKVLAFVRCYEEERILAVFNLSRFAQAVELDLSAFDGLCPVELFGRTEFPRLRQEPYFLTLGPHGFYWFALERVRPERVMLEAAPEQRRAVIAVSGTWESALEDSGRARLQEALPEYLAGRRWFGGKARRIASTVVRDILPLRSPGSNAYLTLIDVAYTEGTPETYVLPMAFATGERAEALAVEAPHAVVARLRVGADGGVEEGVLYDAVESREVAAALFQLIGGRRRPRGANGGLLARTTPAFRQIRAGAAVGQLEPNVLRTDQSNTSILYGDRFFLKLFRRLDEGVNPDLEMGLFLTQRRFTHTPPVAGVLEYRRGRAEPATVGVLKGFVPNEGDAWQYTVDALGGYFERTLASREAHEEAPAPGVSSAVLLALVDTETPPLAHELIGTYLESAWLIGRRSAELHLALASESDNPAFAPEPFSALYQRSLYQSMRNLTGRMFQMLERGQTKLPERVQHDARLVLGLKSEVLRRFRSVTARKVSALRIRCHGDYHLGQLLYTGKDFVVIDFEGEPARSLGERRLKRSALSDVAGMLRSFHYAAFAALLDREHRLVRPEDIGWLEPWARYWYGCVGATFLRAYLECAGGAPFLPETRAEFELLLDVFRLEKAIYELGYELNNRPHWLMIPMQGILQLVET